MRMRISQPLLIAAALLVVSQSGARAEADHAAIARASLTQVIRPGYAAFAAAAGALQGKVATLCQQPSAAALREARDAFAGDGSGVEQGGDHPLRPHHARASFRAPVLLARSQGPRSQADPGRPGQARGDGDRARRDCRQERGAPGLARARISALRRRRQPSQGGPRLPLSLRARRRHQCGSHRQVRGRGMARGLGLREGVPRPGACRPLSITHRKR